MTYVGEHLDRLLDRYAGEDHCTPEGWKQRAIYSTVMQRYRLEQMSREDLEQTLGSPTDLSESEAQDWPHPTGMPLRRVGWLDQKGRVWKEMPSSKTFDGGSLTPLLILVDD